jgi:hypothetical protein
MATFGELIHGRKPEFAPLHILDPMEMMKQLLSGEIQNWPFIESLGQHFQDYMVGQLENLIPNFSDILKEGGVETAAIQKEAKPLIAGEIPEDVQAQVARSAAFQSLMAGTAGGPMAGALTARDFGLSSLDLMQKGANLEAMAGNAAQRWAGLASGTVMNPSSQLYSPEWFAQFRQQQETAKTASKQLRYNLEAMPDPAWADRAKMFANIVGMVAGGGMGGGGGLGASIGSTYAANQAAMGGQYAPTSDFGKNVAAPPATYNPGLQTQTYNPGFLQNYQNAYYNQNPGGVPQGWGGALGSMFGNWFNQSARGG